MYRHVDVLNSAGIAAAVVHGTRGFRCTWFDNDTRIEYLRETPLDGAVLVLPEVAGQRAGRLAPRQRKVIFNQNAYRTFERDDAALDPRETPYLHPDVEAAIVVSADNAAYLRYAFPALRIFRTVNEIEPALFFPAEIRRRRIAYMPRRNGAHGEQVVRLLRLRGVLDDVEVASIDGAAEREVAAVLRDSLVFLSLGDAEGCPTPPKEAMACGCLTVGYHGMGGRDFFTPDVAYPIDVGDIVAFAETVERILREHPGERTPLSPKARSAAKLIRERYSPERSRGSILDCWRELLGDSRGEQRR